MFGSALAAVERRLARPRVRLLAALALGLPPWVVLFYEGGVEVFFAFGFFNTTAWHLVTLPGYLAVAALSILPRRILAWPFSVALWALAVANVALAVVDLEDRRVTAGLFALAGFNQFLFAAGFWSVESRVALPVGAALLWAAALYEFRVGVLARGRPERVES